MTKWRFIAHRWLGQIEAWPRYDCLLRQPWHEQQWQHLLESQGHALRGQSVHMRDKPIVCGRPLPLTVAVVSCPTRGSHSHSRVSVHVLARGHVHTASSNLQWCHFLYICIYIIFSHISQNNTIRLEYHYFSLKFNLVSNTVYQCNFHSEHKQERCV